MEYSPIYCIDSLSDRIILLFIVKDEFTDSIGIVFIPAGCWVSLSSLTWTTSRLVEVDIAYTQNSSISLLLLPFQPDLGSFIRLKLVECASRQIGDQFQLPGQCTRCTCVDNPSSPIFAECTGYASGSLPIKLPVLHCSNLINSWFLCSSCGLALLRLTPEQERRGCEVVQASRNLPNPQCCRVFVRCPPRFKVPSLLKDLPFKLPTKQEGSDRLKKLFNSH